MILDFDLRAAWAGTKHFLRFDAAGIAGFDPSLAGCRRSFRACALTLIPLYLLRVLDWQAAGSRHDLTLVLAIHTIGYVVEVCWLALMLRPLCRLLGREDRWPLLVTMLNWLGLFQTTALAIVDLFGYAGLGGIADLFSVLLLLFLLVVEGFAASVAIGFTASAGLAVVLLDLFVSFLGDVYMRALL